jgi:excisionase family DNA binding protein
MAEYVKIPGMARRLDVSETTARRYIKTGKLPSIFIGGAYRVTEQDLARYIEAAKVTHHPKAEASPSSRPLPLFSDGETQEERRAIEALDTHLGKLEEALDRGEMDREAATLHLYIVQVVGPTIPALMDNVAVDTALRPMAERFLSLSRRVLVEARRLGVDNGEAEAEAEAVIFELSRYRRAS